MLLNYFTGGHMKEKEQLIEVDVPNVLFDSICRNCPNLNNNSCNGICIENFIINYNSFK